MTPFDILFMSFLPRNMHPEQKKSWIEYVTQKIANQETALKQKESDYTKTESAMTSRHDHLREDLAGEINTQQRLLTNQRAFLNEIENADLRFRVESGAYVDLVINDQPQQLLFMNIPGELPDVDVITPQSPIGQAIKDKIAGDKGSFSVGSQKFAVEIKSLL